jgi:hypothetical protein
MLRAFVANHFPIDGLVDGPIDEMMRLRMPEGNSAK